MPEELETIIGLEVHVQLATKSKAFCSCPTNFESLPNTNICPICCGYPGVLPVFNRKALELGLRVCLALGCKINGRIYFERKNYFYPDLPKNYQISQYKVPLGEGGCITLSTGRKIGIERAHLEEDAGKLIHKEDCSLVDFNRTGIPLLEIVSKPDINSADEAFRYLKLLKLTLQYLGVSSCDMEKGYLRCDANISLKEKRAKELGTKVELKNMNSFHGVKDALESESRRQRISLEKGERILQETRLWDETKKQTFIMRTKEEAHDYRYFPEPDLVDFVIEEPMIEEQRSFISELPAVKEARFKKEYMLRENGLTEKEIDILISHKWLADFFELSVKELGDSKNIANWILGPFLELTNSLDKGFEQVKITPANFSKIVKYFLEGRLNNLGAKKVLVNVLTNNEDIDKVIEKEKLTQVSKEEGLMPFVEQTISENPKPVSDYLGGKQSAIMFLVGCVMRKSRGKANPKVVKEMLEKRIKVKGGKI
ncbi:MAG: Asp-tRNA(Asn)/Glu-tRNA(Gln) amidotransferase subunit GatB [Candidatus Omnitrophica bacterium]|nr:Asp-tRNA(Asn)/Glu-tRNA(Gln) amidotransferase subunit GatB [Candidatus Omnitrophota bacterium]